VPALGTITYRSRNTIHRLHLKVKDLGRFTGIGRITPDSERVEHKPLIYDLFPSLNPYTNEPFATFHIFRTDDIIFFFH
jgi:hypothetical protein